MNRHTLQYIIQQGYKLIITLTNSISRMNKTKTKLTHQSLDKLPSLSMHTRTHSKLFTTKDQLMKTKRLLLQRVNDKQSNTQQGNQGDKKQMRRSFIQYSGSEDTTNSVFRSFRSINREQSQAMVSQLSTLRSQSTQLRKCLVKAQIVYNQVQVGRINQLLQQRKQQQNKTAIKRIQELTSHTMNRNVKIHSKLKNKIKDVTAIKLTMNYNCYEGNLQTWKPFVDFDAMPVLIHGTCYFVGGRKKDTPLVTYSISEDKWRQNQRIAGLKPFGQCANTIVDNGRVMFFGGYNYYQQGFSLINNTLKIIDFDTSCYKEIQFDETKLPPRSFHAQCLYGKYLIVSGGLNKDSKCFNNFMTYQMDKNFWSELTINQMPIDLVKGFAKHQTISIFHRRKIYSIYNSQKIVEIDPQIKQEGIYIYGGQNTDGDVMSKMFLVKLGSPSIDITEIKTDGKAPLGRRNMKMIRHKAFIIIHGGRNDEMKPFSLNSMHFLHLKTLSWIQVQGQKPPYRYSHEMGVINSEIVILGGKSHEGLCKQVFIMPMEQIARYI